MILMGLSGLGDPTYQTFFTENLPNCTAEDAGGRPCKAPDGTILYLFNSCSQVAVGTPCYLVADVSGPTATNAPSDSTVETVQNDPFLTPESKAQAEADAARRAQIAQLTKWGIALAIGLVAGVGLFTWKG